MRRNFLVISILTFAIVLSFAFKNPVFSASETQLLMDASSSTGSGPYQQTQWYGASATGGQGYRVILSPLTGNADVFLLDGNFNLVGNSSNSGLTQDNVWYGQNGSGLLHIAVFGANNPSSNFTIQVITSPYVSLISPNIGNTGTLVTLTGMGFGSSRGSSYVQFGSVVSTNYVIWNNTTIQVYVPSGIASGSLQVVVYVAAKPSNPSSFSSNALSSNGTMFMYDTARTGNYLTGGVTSLPLNLKWNRVVTYIGGSLVFANNILYLEGNSQFNAYDSTDGALKWSYATVAGATNGHNSAITNGVVYFQAAWYVSSIRSYDGKLYALDANTGTLKWSYAIGNNYSSPLVENGIVYASSGNGKLYAIDAATGVLKWSYADTNSTASGILGSPSFSNNIIYFISAGYLYSINSINGALKWKVAAGNLYLYSTPVIANNIVYVNNYGDLKAFDANTGILKWKYTVSTLGKKGTFGIPAVANNIVFAMMGETNGSKLCAIDVLTGALKWSYLFSTTGDGDVTPIYANSLVYISLYGKLYIFNANTGALSWSYDTSNANAHGGVTLGNGKAYLATKAGFFCLGQ